MPAEAPRKTGFIERTRYLFGGFMVRDRRVPVFYPAGEPLRVEGSKGITETYREAAGLRSEHNFSITADIPPQVVVGLGGGFIIGGVKKVNEIIVGSNPSVSGEIIGRGQNVQIDTDAATVVANTGSIYIAEDRHVGHLNIQGPVEIYTPWNYKTQTNYDPLSFIDSLDIAEGVHVTINGKPAESFLEAFRQKAEKVAQARAEEARQAPLPPLHPINESTVTIDGRAMRWKEYRTIDGAFFTVTQDSTATDEVKIVRTDKGFAVVGESIHTVSVGRGIVNDGSKPLNITVSDANKVNIYGDHTVYVTGEVSSVSGNNGTVVIGDNARVGSIGDGIKVDYEG